ncbi:MAG TPA: glycerol-3-phosphate 1-O-acyltransferase PlsY [Rhizobiaceae bacterium]|nr:glycerol-3-phosphate 1-O-acyltransferase PlsY [Rhizobiaceae bacterium]
MIGLQAAPGVGTESSLSYVIVGTALVLGYLLGSIPFGLIITRAAGLGDVRKIGSGNIGATNVLRTGRRGLAAATLLLDALKGAAAVLAVEAWLPGLGLVAGFGAFLGHLFPVWLGFRGGKGVATYAGVLFAVAWQVGLIFAAVWIAVAAITRYSSLSALLGSLVAPIAIYLLFQRADAAIAMALMTVLVFIKHRANIGRLLAGTESRIGAKG